MQPHSHPPKNNLIIAMVICMAFMFAWQYFYVEPILREQQQAQEAQRKLNEEKILPSLEDQITQPEAPAFKPRKERLKEIPSLGINTSTLHGSVSLKGGAIHDLTLANYKVAQEYEAAEVVLFSPAQTAQVHYANVGWLSTSKALPMPSSSTVWQASHNTLSPEQPVTLRWDNGAGLVFERTLSIDEHYMFTVTQTVTNNSANSLSFAPYALLNRSLPPIEAMFISHEGPVVVADDILNETTYEELFEDKKISYKQVKGWFGFSDKYWLSAIIPSDSSSFDIEMKYFNKNGQDRFQMDYLGHMSEIAPGESLSSTQHLFAGPKKIQLLDEYETSLNIPLFDHAIDFGILYFLTRPVLYLLNSFNDVLGNFGLAIMLLTVLIKLLLYPLANKSYVSMQQMKDLQPKMKEMNERYKNDMMARNKAMMEMYKREKVNPASGCWPMLIQIPFFFALYKVLYVTIEMRHAPFFGWISDLSAPDPANIFTFFGYAPWDFPFLIGVWPILVALTMYIQQRINPQPTDPVQAKVLKYMPLIFLFIFAGFPAGLCLYWAWSNVLTILQQLHIRRRLHKKKSRAES